MLQVGQALQVDFGAWFAATRLRLLVRGFAATRLRLLVWFSAYRSFAQPAGDFGKLLLRGECSARVVVVVG